MAKCPFPIDTFLCLMLIMGLLHYFACIHPMLKYLFCMVAFYTLRFMRHCVNFVQSSARLGIFTKHDAVVLSTRHLMCNGYV